MNKYETIAFLGIGSNRGDRAEFLQQALRSLAATAGVSELRLSPVYESAAVGAAGPGRFLNAVIELRTMLSPLQLLTCLQGIESTLGRGRERGPDRAGARTIDLDILFYGNVISETQKLTIPHPRLHERDFVLVPLADLAPELRHPATGATITELLDQLLHRDTTLTPHPLRFVGDPDTAPQQ